jgi:hypothetical protein
MNELCANRGEQVQCKNYAVKGHIYCDPCRLQTGGYNRYNPPSISNHQLATKELDHGSRP